MPLFTSTHLNPRGRRGLGCVLLQSQADLVPIPPRPHVQPHVQMGTVQCHTSFFLHTY
ncbi:rCG24130, isoform CRA_c [Rattus norvegicus]|uniref:RCG24130, isoform CRA_c n=1 Tax=Rattus norvegicus TaxID=10116 RepID=A6KAI1_RAT|nr:rCG24130, isoform CRA_c [Rattus norvegicus]